MNEPRSASPSMGQGFASLAILFHLFAVGVVLAGNYAPSSFLASLARMVAPYTKPLHFDPGYKPLFVSQGTVFDHDYSLEFELLDDGRQLKRTLRVPSSESKFGLDRRRIATLLRGLAFATSPDRDDEATAGLVVRQIAKPILLESKDARRCLVKLRRRIPQPMDITGLPDNPDDKAYFQFPYEAEVWMDEDGDVQLIRRNAGGDDAPTAQNK